MKQQQKKKKKKKKKKKIVSMCHKGKINKIIIKTLSKKSNQKLFLIEIGRDFLFLKYFLKNVGS